MQHPLKHTRALASAMVFGLTVLPALADSTSSASSAASQSVGSVSTSLEKSSGSSSSKERVAQGNYTVVEIVAAAEQPDVMQLRMQAVSPAATKEFVLLLPRLAAEQAQLAAGQTIAATQRPYGLALATVNTAGVASPFFLVLEDDWYRELESRPVVL